MSAGTSIAKPKTIAKRPTKLNSRFLPENISIASPTDITSAPTNIARGMARRKPVSIDERVSAARVGTVVEPQPHPPPALRTRRASEPGQRVAALRARRGTIAEQLEHVLERVPSGCIRCRSRILWRRAMHRR